MGGIESIIGYKFKNMSLLETALTHRSVKGKTSNQNLEFLGDSILGFIIAEVIFRRNPDFDEGAMTGMRKNLVSQKPLADAVSAFGLEKYLRLGKNEYDHNVQKTDKTKCDLYEALLAAIYLDGGMDEARAFVKKTLGNLLEKLESEDERDLSDYKSRLKEFADKHHLLLEFRPLPASDEKLFSFVAILEGDEIGKGSGKSKKEAQQKAARAALENLDK